MSRPTPKAFTALLQAAVNEPGTLSQAYQQFHAYSLGNQLLAWAQCAERGLQPGPMATYPRWRALGRQVKKGEKAITLCMPITVKRKQAEVVPETTTDEPRDVMTWFVCKPRWFVLSQTDGDPMPAPERSQTGTPVRRSRRLRSRRSPSTTAMGTAWGSPGSGRSPSTP